MSEATAHQHGTRRGGRQAGAASWVAVLLVFSGAAQGCGKRALQPQASNIERNHAVGGAEAGSDATPTVNPSAAAEDSAEPQTVSSGPSPAMGRADRATSARTTGPDGAIEHALGELPPHTLTHCVLHAGESKRRSKTVTPAPAASSPSKIESVTRVVSCSFNSECGTHLGQAPGPTDGAVNISCQQQRCTCTVTTYSPAELNRYTFDEIDPCREIESLLRQRCGG